MQITHRALTDAAALPEAAAVIQPAELALTAFNKAPRLSCCCRLSELLPKVREMHDAVRAARLASEQADVAA